VEEEVPQKIPEAAGIEKAKGYIEGLGEDFGKKSGSELKSK